MAGLKRLVGVALTVVVLTALTAYVLRPAGTPNAAVVVVNEPEPTVTSKPLPFVDTNAPDHGRFTHDGWAAAEEPSKPARLSSGPNHQVCLPANDNIAEQARQRGANWYRFYDQSGCGAFPGLRLSHNW